MTPTGPSLHTFSKRPVGEQPQHTAELLQQVSWALVASGHQEAQNNDSLWKATQQSSPDVPYWKIEVDRKVELNIKGFNFVSSILTQTKSCI